MEVLLLRHAPTEWNRDGRIQGRTDVPLSAEGLALARGWRVPEFAAGWSCLTSPLVRAVATAEAMGLTPQPMPGLIEMDWGRLEGLTLAAMRADPDFVREEAKGLDFRPGGGETPREVADRVFACLATVGEDAVVVTHKGIIRALLALATGWDMQGRAPVRLVEGRALRLEIGRDRPILLDGDIPLAASPCSTEISP